MGTKQFSNYESLLTFTRASKGHALRPVSYGDELVENGDFAANSDWTLEYATISGGVVSVTSGFRFLAQDAGLEVGKVYYVSFDYTETSSSQLRVNTTATNAGQEALITSTSGTGSGTIQGAVVAEGPYIAIEAKTQVFTGTIDNVSVKEVTFDQPDGTLTLFEHPNNVPRVEWDADRNRLGLLVEEARTNLVPYSNFSSDWGETRSTLTTNALASPDGQLNGASIKASTDSNSHYIADTISISSSTRYTSSVFFKAGGKNWATIYNGAGNVYFDLENGVIGNITGTNNTTAQIQEIGDGWYRCSISFDAGASATSYNFAIGPALANGDNTYVGDNSTEEIYVYGAQVEQGSFPTSYIKNEGTSSGVTRSADVASIPVADFGYNQSVWSVVVVGQSYEPGFDNYFFEMSKDSSNRNFVKCANGQHLIVTSGGVTQAILDAGEIAANTEAKLAVSVQADDFAASLDGGAVVTDTSGTTNLDVTDLKLGMNRSNGEHLNGHIKSIQYYPRRLSNAQLVELTS